MEAVILFCFCAVLSFAAVSIRDTLDKRELRGEITTMPFKVSEYLDRIEKESIRIKQKEKEKYDLVLWWGTDGLKLLENGDTEWIHRGEEPFSHLSGSGGLGAIPSSVYYPSYLYYGAQQFRPMNPYYQMQSQVAQIQIQAAQQAQNRTIEQAIQSYRDENGNLKRSVFERFL